MLTEKQSKNAYLGQFIPLQYHHSMLRDANRMLSFKSAIDQVVFPGAKVLELGGGTGVLSFFAAAKAEKVWCVEFNSELVRESRRLLAKNENGHKVEVIHADAFEYLPPEPVDVMICEMIHVAMLREKQVQMMGPVPAPMTKKSGTLHYQLLFIADKRNQLHEVIASLILNLEQTKIQRQVKWSIDIDPIDLY